MDHRGQSSGHGEAAGLLEYSEGSATGVRVLRTGEILHVDGGQSAGR
ncbi:hypothetical protein [Amycolatopsis sp. NPDC021455]